MNVLPEDGVKNTETCRR